MLGEECPKWKPIVAMELPKMKKKKKIVATKLPKIEEKKMLRPQHSSQQIIGS